MSSAVGAQQPVATATEPDGLAPPAGPGVYTAPNGWTIVIAGQPPERAIDELGAEAEVHDLESKVRQDEHAIGYLADRGLDFTPLERDLAAHRADLARARHDLAVLRAPRPGWPVIRGRRVFVGARAREQRARRRRTSSRAGPDSDDPEPARRRPHAKLLHVAKFPDVGNLPFARKCLFAKTRRDVATFLFEQKTSAEPDLAARAS